MPPHRMLECGREPSCGDCVNTKISETHQYCISLVIFKKLASRGMLYPLPLNASILKGVNRNLDK